MTPVLQRALPIVGSALGRKLGVQVEVSGHRACTNGECIWLPAFDPQRPDQERLMWGFLSHEAAHVRYTDFSLDQSGSAFRRRLTNLLEDVRIEKEISREYPGAAFSLAEVVRQLVSDGRLSAPNKSDSPVKVLHDSLLVILRYKVLGQNALELEASKAQEVMNVRFSTELLSLLKSLLDKVPMLKSTQEAQTLADQLIALFQNHRNKDSDNQTSEQSSPDNPENSSGDQETDCQPPEPQHKDGKSEPLSGDDLESNAVQGNEDNPENLSGEQSQEDFVGSKGDSKGDSNQAEATVLNQILQSKDEDWPEDLFQSVAQEMESWSNGQDASLSAVTTTPQTDQIVISDQSRGAAKDLLGKVQSESARLAAQLTGMVQAKTLTRQRTGKRGLRIDGKRLHRMAIDDGRVFKQRSESVTIDATIHISLDISASMGSRMELAREAVLSLVLALKQINGVTISASAYPGTQADRVYPIASANDSGKTAAEILTMLDSHDTTPMATGLWHAVHQVLQARTERRLILMVTDGEPDIDHRKSVIDLVNRCGQSGIEVVGLGIHVHTVEQLFPKSLVIDRLAQLKASIFELTRAWLIA